MSAGELIPDERIERSILQIRGQKVILDRDLANLYEVPTKVLNQAVKRNLQRFPVDFMDGHHASTAGRYLGACVWYEVLFNTTCVGNKFTAGLDADYAKFLQATAHAAVQK